MQKLAVTTKIRSTLILIVVFIAVIAGVEYHNSEARSSAAALAKSCAEQTGKPFQSDLACISKPAARR